MTNLKKYSFIFVLIVVGIIACVKSNEQALFYFKDDADFIQNNKHLSDTARLGKLMFFDTNLSQPKGISCATCHSPSTAFSDPRMTAFSEGVDPKHLTDRNSIAISYNILAPQRQGAVVRGVIETVGGFFWDGRAHVLEAQAFSPLLNANEMNNGTIANAANKIKSASYFEDFKKVFNDKNLKDDQLIMYYAMLALKSFQKSFQVNPYTSKFDFFMKGEVALTDAEMRGWKLFQDTVKTKCSLCHVSDINPFTNTIVFTDYSYDNIGTPKHPSQIGMAIDSGAALSEPIRNPLEIAMFRTPTLRNVNRTAPYMHNGVFETLEDVMDFYNHRDDRTKYTPEYEPTMNTEDVKSLDLSDNEIKDIIAFLKTLDDGYVLKQK